MGTSELSEKADEMLRKGGEGGGGGGRRGGREEGGREEGREGGREEEKVNRNGMATISYTPSRCMLSSG